MEFGQTDVIVEIALPALGLVVHASAADTHGRISMIESVGQRPAADHPAMCTHVRTKRSM